MKYVSFFTGLASIFLFFALSCSGPTVITQGSGSGPTLVPHLSLAENLIAALKTGLKEDPAAPDPAKTWLLTDDEWASFESLVKSFLDVGGSADASTLRDLLPVLADAVQSSSDRLADMTNAERLALTTAALETYMSTLGSSSFADVRGGDAKDILPLVTNATLSALARTGGSRLDSGIQAVIGTAINRLATAGITAAGLGDFISGLMAGAIDSLPTETRFDIFVGRMETIANLTVKTLAETPVTGFNAITGINPVAARGAQEAAFRMASRWEPDDLLYLMESFLHSIQVGAKAGDSFINVATIGFAIDRGLYQASQVPGSSFVPPKRADRIVPYLDSTGAPAGSLVLVFRSFFLLDHEEFRDNANALVGRVNYSYDMTTGSLQTKEVVFGGTQYSLDNFTYDGNLLLSDHAGNHLEYDDLGRIVRLTSDGWPQGYTQYIYHDDGSFTRDVRLNDGSQWGYGDYSNFEYSGTYSDPLSGRFWYMTNSKIKRWAEHDRFDLAGPAIFQTATAPISSGEVSWVGVLAGGSTFEEHFSFNEVGKTIKFWTQNVDTGIIYEFYYDAFQRVSEIIEKDGADGTILLQDVFLYDPLGNLSTVIRYDHSGAPEHRWTFDTGGNTWLFNTWDEFTWNGTVWVLHLHRTYDSFGRYLHEEYYQSDGITLLETYDHTPDAAFGETKVLKRRYYDALDMVLVEDRIGWKSPTDGSWRLISSTNWDPFGIRTSLREIEDDDSFSWTSIFQADGVMIDHYEKGIYRVSNPYSNWCPNYSRIEEYAPDGVTLTAYADIAWVDNLGTGQWYTAEDIEIVGRTSSYDTNDPGSFWY